MTDEPIGSARVAIVGDYSNLSSDFKAAETAAGVAGEKIASSFNASSIKTATLQLSIGNLKQVFSNDGRQFDWFDPAQAEGRYFLRRATQVKNIWVPYGE